MVCSRCSYIVVRFVIIIRRGEGGFKGDWMVGRRGEKIGGERGRGMGKMKEGEGGEEGIGKEGMKPNRKNIFC